MRLEKALGGMKDAVLEQANRVQLGAMRLLYYTSYFTDNYQDVCAGQKSEDVRFMEALVHLVKRLDVIRSMFEIDVDHLLRNNSPDRLQRIQKALIKKGTNIATSSPTNQALSSAIVAAIGYSFGATIAIDTKLAKISEASVTIFSDYGYVQEAAYVAGRLRQQLPAFSLHSMPISWKCFISSLSRSLTEMPTFIPSRRQRMRSLTPSCGSSDE
ncbi:hypothetical protein [Pantoea sp.]|uniref:hypothetical protein n=1 Tax=Pantoea sp. TaxID=69393 RepID=UPI0028ACB03F|nr:hypothetical protein [Pantoea sp.]